MFARLLAPAVLLLVCAAPSAAQTSSAPAPFPALDSSATVRAVVTDDRTAYVGGSFTSAGPPSGPFALVSGTDGSFVRNAPGLVNWGFPDNNDGEDLTAEGRAVISDGAGGWYVAGGFARANGTQGHELVRLRADGSVDPAFLPEANGTVHDLVLHDGTLWAAGGFDRIGGRTIEGLAALDPVTGAARAYPANSLSSTAVGLALDGDRLYVAGRFGLVGDVPRGGLAAVDVRDGSLIDWCPVVPSPGQGEGVLDVAAVGGIVYLLGDLRPNTDEYHGAIAYRATDASEVPLAFGGLTEGRAIAATPRAVVISGDYRDDSTVKAFVPGTDQRLPWFAGETWLPTAMEAVGDRLYVSGLRDGSVVTYDLRTGAPDGFVSAALGPAEGLAVAGGQIALAGHDLSGAPQTPRAGVMAVDLGSNALTPLNPASGTWFVPPGSMYYTRGTVYALAKSADTLFMGGYFIDVAGGRPEKNLAAVNVQTGAWLDLPDVEGTVWALAVSGTRLFIGGDISKIGDVAVKGLGAVDLSTGQVLPWAPQFSRPVGELVVSGQTLHASGGFNLVDGANRSGVASFDLATLAPSTVFTARGQSAVSGIAADGTGGLWIGGEMTDWGGVPVAGVVHLRADGSIDPDMPRLNGSGRVYTLTVSAGQLFLGGFFRSVDGVPRDLMASVRLDDRTVTGFRPNLDESIYALAPAPGGVIAGGDFRMTELTHVSGVARFGAAASGSAPVVVSRPRVYGSTFAGGSQHFEGLEFSGSPSFVETRWLRCDASGAACEQFEDDWPWVGVRASDAGHRFRVEAVAYNDAGASAPVRSAPGPLLSGATPERILGAEPVLWGEPRVGARLGFDVGLYAPGASSFGSGYQRCDASGCKAIDFGFGPGPGYVISERDVGFRIRVTVRPGYAADGAPRAISNELGPILAGPSPGGVQGAVTPVLSGSSQVGEILFAAVPEAASTSYRFGWQRCDTSGSACADIAGTGRALRLAAEHVGTRVRVWTVAYGPNGVSARGYSAPSAVVAADPNEPAPDPSPSPSPSPSPEPSASPSPSSEPSPTASPSPEPNENTSPSASPEPPAILAAPPAPGVTPLLPTNSGARALPLVTSARVVSRKASSVLVRVRASRAGRYEVRVLSGKRVVARKTVTLRRGITRSLRLKVPRRASSLRAVLHRPT